MGIDGLALASSLAIVLYTVILALIWYRRTGWDEARQVGAVALRNLPVAAVAGLASWVSAEWLMNRFAEPGLASSIAAVALGGVVLLAISLIPARREFR
jgi:peptidoglycan biosynthesis protein MviN/MurJ (putative lipid II flippase)